MTANDPQHFDPQDFWGFQPDDPDHQLQAMQQFDRATLAAIRFAPEAVQFMIDIMQGRIKDPNGEYVEVHDVHERRLAAKTLLEMAGIGSGRTAIDGRDSLLKGLFNG